jgi:hypothetical protein
VVLNILTEGAMTVLALKGLKSQDELEELENDFWKYVDETVWHLSVFRSS